MTYEVIIPAAGAGKRMGLGKNKLFIKLNNVPVIVHTLHVFESDPRCRKIIVVINLNEQEEFENMVALFGITKEILFVKGGSERQYSVANGLKSCTDDGVVLIHDGARPFVTIETITKLVAAANRDGAAVAAVRVKDTIKKVHNNVVVETVERSSLWSIQTPQAFRVQLIKNAHALAKRQSFFGTDDASIAEFAGEKVTVVESNYDNIKLTTPEDIYFAEAILRKEEQRR